VYSLLADMAVIVHLGFVAFVALGGFLVWRWRRLAWIHIPCAMWAVLVEWLNLVCPLTPLEQHLRTLAGEPGYQGGFVEHYLVPLLYPPGLTRVLQLLIAALVVAVNIAVYARLWLVDHATDRS